jgi:hypothetical protein
MTVRRLLFAAVIALVSRVAAPLAAEQFTRGLGVYPGDPLENFAPVLEIDRSTYRNLALHRPAYHSSSYDYNLTAQLVTDGIKTTVPPHWIAVATSQHGMLKRHKREWPLDGNWVSTVDFKGPSAWLQIELGGGEQAPEVDGFEVEARVHAASQQPENWACTVAGSDDGESWQELGRAVGMARPGGNVATAIAFEAPARRRFYRVTFSDPRAVSWQVGELRLVRGGRQVHIAGPHNFASAWMSAGGGQEWVSVDLGAEARFDRVALHWVHRAAEGALQVSDDAASWRTVQALPAGETGASGATDELKLRRPVRAPYVRILMTKPASPEGYVLSELEVFGRGGPVPRPAAAPAPRAGGRLDLAGGRWRVQRDSLVAADGRALSTPGFDDRDWLIATVPGTVLTSWYNAGALPDPNFGDNQLMVSDSFFYADFWYRNEWVAPPRAWEPVPLVAGRTALPGLIGARRERLRAAGRRAWLHFDGINWKADVFLNGEALGRIEGGFTRARFDVTDRLRPGEPNALAVRIHKNASPGSVKEKTFENPDKNGGALGADNPTYHASIGWDWIPTIRGRNTGIWNDVYLSESGPVTLEDPLVTTALPLPETTSADIAVEVRLRNHTAAPVAGALRGRFGDVAFEMPVTVGASAAQTVRLDPSTHPALRLQSPRLWWPAGYGEPHLYAVELRFDTADGASDAKAFQAGVRQLAYSEEGGALRMWINGRRFVPRGGNWGFAESMLRYRAREYDAAVRYHRDMHSNMIRNWVGQIGDDEFYEACDRHGIVVWQDFWLANPWDGPDPADDAMFLANASDTVRRIRNHPSVGLYCGRNEGYPPQPLDGALRQAVAELHPGLHYIASSADDVASGHGPYRAMPLHFYFGEGVRAKIHSEMGMPNIVTMESLRLMMPERAMWPLGPMWGLHDFSLGGAQGGSSYLERVQKNWGGVVGVADWVALAQFGNYEGYRAMFEAQSRNRTGLLIWMSHPAWPSFVWQTYDYYLEPTAAYFGAKKGSEPLHIQWNPVSETVEVVNYSAGDAPGLTATAQVLDAAGAVRWEKSATLDSAEDTTQSVIAMEYPVRLTPLHFLRLRLTRGDELVSENFYWRGLEEGDYRFLRELPQVKLEVSTTAERQGDRWRLTTDLHNPGSHPALMVRLKAVRAKTGDRILPALYSDNYVALMPGERRTITTELRHADTRGEAPRIIVEGFNAGQVATD